MKDGYTKENAISKVCQDIISKEISESPYFKNITIKGGVVIHSISKNKRRATRDVDLDFVKYSLEDESILINNIDELIIKMKNLFSDKIFIANLKDARNN